MTELGAHLSTINIIRVLYNYFIFLKKYMLHTKK